MIIFVFVLFLSLETRGSMCLPESGNERVQIGAPYVLPRRPFQFFVPVLFPQFICHAENVRAYTATYTRDDVRRTGGNQIFVNPTREIKAYVDATPVRGSADGNCFPPHSYDLFEKVARVFRGEKSV